jgi:hypothetical protein
MDADDLAGDYGEINVPLKELDAAWVLSRHAGRAAGEYLSIVRAWSLLYL